MNSPYDFYITPEEYDIAESNGICRDTLEYRIRKAKFLWEREVALTKPPRKASGEWKKVKHIALQHGVKRQTFSYRRSKGWSVEEASTTPPLSRAESLRRANLLNNNNTVFTREELQQIDKNKLHRNIVYFRYKKLKWSKEDAINLPIVPAEESGRRGKKASSWSQTMGLVFQKHVQI
ncbi:hypothetical protein [Bacillus cereus]|uniref:hypothetical protein n=1 Tax=Bacillus cereus TaxID=1396 RepID=UPI003EE18A78